MYQPPYFIKKFISTNRSRVKDPHFLAKKQPKMDIFEKADYLGLKDPLEVWVHYEICNTICGIPVPTILNHKNSTGSAGEAKNSQNGVFLEVQKYPLIGCFWPLLPTRLNFYGSKWLVQVYCK